MAPSATTTTTLEEYGSLSVKTIPTYPSLSNLDQDGLHFRSLPAGQSIAKQMIGRALQKRVQSIDDNTCDPGDEDAFFVADMGEVYRQHLRWKKNLKRVKPHYGEFFLSFSQNTHFLTLHTDLSPLQPSNATPILRSSVCLPSLALASTVPPSQRSRWSFARVLTPLASSTPSPARPSLTFATLPKKGSNR